MKRLKVLVSAYACEPDKGSEPGVGWHWVKQIARFHEVWVITRENNRESIESKLQKSPDPNLHFVYCDVPKWLSFWKRKQKGIYVYYLLWQVGAYFRAIAVHKRITLDLAHHVTFGNAWLPTFLSLLPIPFIWGPIGGCELVPRQFRSDLRRSDKLRENIRDLIVFALRFNLLFFFNCWKARAIIAKTTDTANSIPLRFRPKVATTCDVAASPEVAQILRNQADDSAIIAVGRLDAWRGFDLLIKAIAIMKREIRGVNLTIIGDGPDMDRLRTISAQCGVVGNVHFAGRVDRIEYFDKLRKSSIFVSPCLREGGVTVMFDALTLGLPVVCMNISGVAEIIDEKCGIKINPENPDQTVKDLAEALIKLATNPMLGIQLGTAGNRKIVEEYSWDKKGDLVRELYAEYYQAD